MGFKWRGLSWVLGALLSSPFWSVSEWVCVCPGGVGFEGNEGLVKKGKALGSRWGNLGSLSTLPPGSVLCVLCFLHVCCEVGVV